MKSEYFTIEPGYEEQAARRHLNWAARQTLADRLGKEGSELDALTAMAMGYTLEEFIDIRLRNSGTKEVATQNAAQIVEAPTTAVEFFGPSPEVIDTPNEEGYAELPQGEDAILVSNP